MNKAQASIKLTYDKVKGGLFSIKLRVCYGSDRPRYHLPVKEGILVKPDMYKRLVSYHQTRSGRVAEEVLRLHKQVMPFVERAQVIVDSLPVFSFAKFENLFYNAQPVDTGPGADLIAWLHQISSQMESEDRIGNADSYKSAAKSLVRFVESLSSLERANWLGSDGRSEKSLLHFEHVTPELLDKYEAWMLKFGKAPKKLGNPPTPASMTTISIYLRQVRAAFNEAIKAGVITKDTYPFGRKEYVIPAGANVKKALKKSVIRQIMEYACEPGSFEERSRDLWVLSYLSNGMNLTDIASLRWSQIDYSDQTITFTRHKTSRTRRGNQIKVVASLFPESRTIIDRWAGPDRVQSGYVFPFLTDEMDARRKKVTIIQLINITNKYMKRIAQALGIQVEIKTYEARHSFASAILKGGGDLNFIKDKLGQSSLKSTEAYLTTIHDEDEQAILRKSLLDE